MEEKSVSPAYHSGPRPGPHASNSFFASRDFDPWTEDLSADGFPDKKESWAVSWSDLMMTMFVLFAVLYVYQAGNRQLRFGPGPGISDVGGEGGGIMRQASFDHSPSEIFDRTKQAVMDEFTHEQVRVDMVDEKAVRITIAGDILFDTGNADLGPRAMERLRQIAAIIQENRYRVNVVGHTDSMPNHSVRYPTNWELSADRAVRTARFLIEQAGIDSDRVFVSAHAWHQPVRPNTSQDDRQLNRRVEIVLVKRGN